MGVEIRFDPAFVEEAVFLELNRLTVSGSCQTVSSFLREREAVYELPDAQQRDAVFQRLAHRTFEALGLAELFTARLSEFPQIPAHVELVVVRRVWNNREERVELYIGPSTPPAALLRKARHAGVAQDSAPQALPVGLHRPADKRLALVVSTTLFIGLQAVRCLDRGRLAAFLRHELMHVADMLDPAFAYDPHPAFVPPPVFRPGGPNGPPQADSTGGWIGGGCEPEHELIRERFRALWDLWVHVRCRHRGWPTILDDDARQRDVMRAFASLDAAAHRELLITVGGRDHWTQDELLTLARWQRVEVVA